MVNGCCIMDVEMLKVVIMVYGGLVNKNIVVGFQVKGVNVIGLIGVDMNVICLVKCLVKDVDYGFVGDVEKVNVGFLVVLICQGIVFVMVLLIYDGKGSMLNINVDIIVGEIVKVLVFLFDVILVYCFEKKGVLCDENDDDSVIFVIIFEEFKEFVV